MTSGLANYEDALQVVGVGLEQIEVDHVLRVRAGTRAEMVGPYRNACAIVSPSSLLVNGLATSATTPG